MNKRQLYNRLWKPTPFEPERISSLADDVEKVLSDHGLDAVGSDCTDILCRTDTLQTGHQLVTTALLKLLEELLSLEQYANNLLFISTWDGQTNVSEYLERRFNINTMTNVHDIRERIISGDGWNACQTTVDCIITHLKVHTTKPLFTNCLLDQISNRLDYFVYVAKHSRLICTSVDEIHLIAMKICDSDVLKCLLHMIVTTMSHYSFFVELLSQALVDADNGTAIVECITTNTPLKNQVTTDFDGSERHAVGITCRHNNAYERLYISAINCRHVDLVKVLRSGIYHQPKHDASHYIWHLINPDKTTNGPWQMFEYFNKAIHVFNCTRSVAEATLKTYQMRILIKYYGKRFNLFDGEQLEIRLWCPNKARIIGRFLVEAGLVTSSDVRHINEVASLLNSHEMRRSDRCESVGGDSDVRDSLTSMLHSAVYSTTYYIKIALVRALFVSDGALDNQSIKAELSSAFETTKILLVMLLNRGAEIQDTNILHTLISCYFDQYEPYLYHSSDVVVNVQSLLQRYSVSDSGIPEMKGDDIDVRVYEAVIGAVTAEIRKLINFILDKGAHINAQNGEGDTALHTLIKNGARMNHLPRTLLCARNVAVEQLAKCLLQMGTNVNIENTTGHTSLSLALSNGQINLVVVIIEFTVNDLKAKFKVDDYWTLLSSAEIWTSDKTIEFLRNQRVDINTRDPKSGQTALHLAVKSVNENAVICLLNAGSDINSSDDNSDTPLLIAVQLMVDFKNSDILAMMLTHRPDYTFEMQYHGEPILGAAIDSRNVALVSQIARRVADINSESEISEGLSPLFYAVRGPNIDFEVVKVLIENGASLNNRIENGETVLHRVLHHHDCEDIVKLTKFLIDAGADVTLTDYWFNSPFHLLYYWPVTGRRTFCENIMKELDVLCQQDIVNAVSTPNMMGIFLRIDEHDYDGPSTDILGNTRLHAAAGVYGFKVACTFMCCCSESSVTGCVVHSCSNSGQRNFNGQTFSHVLLGNRETLTVKAMHLDQRDLDVTDDCGRNLWHMAAFESGMSRLSNLVELATSNLFDMSGITTQDALLRTPAHYMAMHFWETDISYLWANNEKSSALSQRVNKALGIEASNAGEHTKRCKIHNADDFLRSGGKAGCGVRDIFGRTPIYYAIDNTMYRWLMQYEVEPEQRNDTSSDIYGYTAKDVSDSLDTFTEHVADMRTTYLSCLENFSLYFSDRDESIRRLTELLHSSPCDARRSMLSVWPDRIPNFVCTLWNSLMYGYRDTKTDGIGHEALDFMKLVMSEIEKVDSRFKGELLPVGSAHEQCQVDFPNEFDFDVELINFNRICEVAPDSIFADKFVTLRKSGQVTCCSINNYSEFFNDNGDLLTTVVKFRFQAALVKVLTNKDIWLKSLNFEMDNPVDLTSFKLCASFKMRLNRPINGELVHFKISFDITPVIRIHGWWPTDVTHIDDRVKLDGCILVFDQPHRTENVKYNSTPYARISFAPMESQMIRDSPPVVKAAYMISKQLCVRHEDDYIVTRSLRTSSNDMSLDISSHVLKTAALWISEDLPIDALSAKTYEDIKPEDLRLAVQALWTRVYQFARQDFVPSYFMPSLHVPVWNFERFAGQSHADILRRDTTYEQVIRGESDLRDNNRLRRNLINLYIRLWFVSINDSQIDWSLPTIIIK